MGFKNRVLLAPSEREGSGGIKGKNGGQEMNRAALVKMLSRSSEEQCYALDLMRKNQMAVAYVAAFYPHGKVRGDALSRIDDSDSLMLISRSSPFRSIVMGSLNEMGRRIESLSLDACIEVAICSPHPEDRFDALCKARKEIASGKTTLYHSDFHTFESLLFGLRGEDPARVDILIVHNVETLERLVLGFSPYSNEQIEARKGEYSEGALLLILERG